MNRFREGLLKPNRVIAQFVKAISPLIKDDEMYLRIVYYLETKKKLNLNPPVSFNEKMQWLKLHCKDETYTDLVDKATVKEYISQCIGDKYLIPTLGVYNTVEDIDFELLPIQFVLKCTHDSGGLVICKNKQTLNIAAVRKKMKKSLKTNFYMRGREYPYKNVQPRIIAEKYMDDNSGTGLIDYKIYCFGGIPQFLLVVSNRAICAYFDYYDLDFNHLPFMWGGVNSPYKIQRPEKLDEMLFLAQKIAKDSIQMRVDFYEVQGNVYFGEITFFDGAGFTPFEPMEWDEKIGKLLSLPEI
jgi:glycosyltransferase